MPAIKRTKYDAVFSNLVRERADFICETCGKSYRENPQRLHCSHLFGRRSRSTRYDPDNAMAQCWTCHQKYGENPVSFAWYLEKIFGRGHLEIVQAKSHQVLKVKKHELEEMYQHYKKELKRLQDLREQGVEGRIEFEGWF